MQQNAFSLTLLVDTGIFHTKKIKDSVHNRLYTLIFAPFLQ